MSAHCALSPSPANSNYSQQAKYYTQLRRNKRFQSAVLYVRVLADTDPAIPNLGCLPPPRFFISFMDFFICQKAYSTPRENMAYYWAL